MMHALLTGRMIITNINILWAQTQFSNKQMTTEHSVCQKLFIDQKKNHYHS